MNKTFIATALALGLCLPASAAQFTNSESDRYNAPVFEDEADNATTNKTVPHKKTKKQVEKEAQQALPIHLTADHAEYDSVSGEFYATGNVVVTQGTDKLLTTYATGNMKTGDVWLDKGGDVQQQDGIMHGQWAHYNFNTKTGEIKQISGSNVKDIYDAPHATVYPDRIVIDEGGKMSRCPAVKHPPCLSVTAKTFEIYPQEKMVAHDVKVFIRGKHIYSRDLWINNFNDDSTTKIMPRVGYDGSDNGAYVKLEVSQPIGEKTMVEMDLPQYSKVGFKPAYKVSHDERNFRVSYFNGWDEDDDDWYRKQNTWRFDYKNHHIMDGLPLSYSAYYEYGLWNIWNRNNGRSGSKRWRKEYAVYLNHDPIYLFDSKNTVLNLTVGKKWIGESNTDELRSTNMYYATLGQRLGPKWRTWAGYYREDRFSNLYDIGQADMDQELRNGLQWSPDARNDFSIINRYDLVGHKNYETDYRWLHKFCCWAIEFTYEKNDHDGDNSFKLHYYFYNL